MEQAWLFETLTVTLARIDFVDPALAHTPDVRERGVRLEIRPTDARHEGSVYASPSVALEPAVCRIDLLESAPGAADRMHWHPTMPAGEPGDRTFDPAIPADPLGWLDAQLSDVSALLAQAGLEGVARHDRSARDIADCRDQIIAAAAAGLAWARRPWPDLPHDARGMAITS